jgi:hypothetical protein
VDRPCNRVAFARKAVWARQTQFSARRREESNEQVHAAGRRLPSSGWFSSNSPPVLISSRATTMRMPESRKTRGGVWFDARHVEHSQTGSARGRRGSSCERRGVSWTRQPEAWRLHVTPWWPSCRRLVHLFTRRILGDGRSSAAYIATISHLRLPVRSCPVLEVSIGRSLLRSCRATRARKLRET